MSRDPGTEIVSYSYVWRIPDLEGKPKRHHIATIFLYSTEVEKRKTGQSESAGVVI